MHEYFHAIRYETKKGGASLDAIRSLTQWVVDFVREKKIKKPVTIRNVSFDTARGPNMSESVIGIHFTVEK